MQTVTVHQQRAALYLDVSAAAGRQPTVCIMRSAAIGTPSQLEPIQLHHRRCSSRRRRFDGAVTLARRAGNGAIFLRKTSPATAQVRGVGAW